MRVTKLIREYVTTEVGKKYNDRIKNATKAYDEERKSIEEQIKQIAEEANKKAMAIVAEHKGYEIRYCGGVAISTSGTLFNYDKWNEGQQELTKLKEEKVKCINDILITLELGGTKAELEEMIKNIKVDI